MNPFLTSKLLFEIACEIVCGVASSPIAQIKHVEVDKYSEPCIGCVNQSTVIEQSIQIWLGKATKQYTYPLHSKVKSSQACGININLFRNVRLRNINLSWMALARLPNILNPAMADNSCEPSRCHRTNSTNFLRK